MGKPVADRSYAKQIKDSQRNLSPEQIRSAKNDRCKARRASRLQERLETVEERRAKTPQEQIQRLNWRLGKGVGAKRERLRLQEQINASTDK